MASGNGSRSSDRFLPPDPRVAEPYRFTPQAAVRVAILGILALGLFGVLFLRLWAVQVLSGTQYAQAAENNRIRERLIEAPRGTILDRNGVELVTNVAASAVLLYPAELPKGKGRDTELRRLAAVLNVPFKRIVREIRERRGDFLTPIKVQIAVHRDQVAYLREHASEFPGVTIDDTYLRRYKAEALAAHVLGYTGQITREELKRRRKDGFHGGETVGLAGVEATYDEDLRGTPGVHKQVIDARNRPIGIREEQTPFAGASLRLTIDIELQRAAERAIRYGIQLARDDGQWAADGGAIVAIDPSDGAILAMASNPTYKPGIWVGKIDPKEIAPLLDQKVAKARNYPGLNRATAGLYPPGSTWKPMTAVAALETPSIGISPYAPLQCTPTYEAAGQVFKNWNPDVNEAMDMPAAIAASCDTYFYQIGHRFYGLEARYGHPLQSIASQFGFGARTGIDIGPEEAGLLPTPGWREKTFTKKTDPCCWEIDKLWKPGDSIQLAIGQKDLLVTPLQMAVFYSAIANGGQLVTPHVVMDIERLDDTPGGKRTPVKVVRPINPATTRIDMDRGILDPIRKGLYDATHAEYGTATGVFGSFPVGVAGKTGTAEKAVQLPGYTTTMDQSWFCGYGPVNSTGGLSVVTPGKSLVVCAVIENGGHGGTAAAPAVRKVFEKFFGVTGGGVEEVYSD